MDEFLAKLREMLALPADASTDDILSRISAGFADAGAHTDAAAAHRAGTFDPARYVDVAQFQQALTELNALKIERARERAEHAVDAAIRSGKLVPAHREWAIAYCAADPRGFESFAARQPVVLPGELNLSGDPRAMMSRSHAGRLLSATEIAICSLLGVTPADFAKRKDGSADFLHLNKDHSDPSL